MDVVMQRRHTFEPNLSVEPMGVLLGEVPGHRDMQLRQVRDRKLVYCARILMNQQRPPVRWDSFLHQLTLQADQRPRLEERHPAPVSVHVMGLRTG